MKKLIWIHGANASPASFAYLSDNLKNIDSLFLTYDPNDGLETILTKLKNEIEEKGFENGSIIAHSLGGVIALLLSRHLQFSKIITLSAPFGGSRMATILKWWLPNYQLFKDISHTSEYTKDLMELPSKTPVFSFVTESGGTPLMAEPNDGVVTVESQMALKYPTYIKMPLNHFEILLSKEVTNQISKLL